MAQSLGSRYESTGRSGLHSALAARRRSRHLPGNRRYCFRDPCRVRYGAPLRWACRGLRPTMFSCPTRRPGFQDFAGGTATTREAGPCQAHARPGNARLWRRRAGENQAHPTSKRLGCRRPRTLRIARYSLSLSSANCCCCRSRLTADVMMAARIKQFQAFMALTQMLVLPLFLLSGALYPLNGRLPGSAFSPRSSPLTYMVGPIPARRVHPPDYAGGVRAAPWRRPSPRPAAPVPLGTL